MINDEKHSQSLLKQKKASVLLMVILITTFLALLIGSVLKWGSTEAGITERHFVKIKAMNASESLVSSGISQLVLRWKQKTTFPLDELAPGNNPLIVPSSFANFFAGTPVVLSDAEIIGGIVPPGSWIYIDPNDPSNADDPLKGKNVFTRNVIILGKAKAQARQATDPNDKITSFATETVQVRDSPLFGHAAFYNMDLEFHPGPNMDMWGPIHTNGNLYSSATNNLYFHGVVTISKDYLHRLAPGQLESQQTGNVWFRNSLGNFINDYKGTGDKAVQSSYYDSLYSNWTAFASQTWDGFLQTQAQGVPNLNVIGYEDYVRDDPSTPAVDDDLNYAYAIIEPNQPYNGGANPLHKGENGEREKYAQKAGLTLRLHDTMPVGVTGITRFQLSTNYWVTFHRLKRTNTTQPNSPPIRNWGFYTGFSSGLFPPGMPIARSFRGLDFRYLKESDYKAKKA